MPSTRITSLMDALEVQSPAEVIRSPATKKVCQGQRTELPQLVRIGSARTIAGISPVAQRGGLMDLGAILSPIKGSS